MTPKLAPLFLYRCWMPCRKVTGSTNRSLMVPMPGLFVTTSSTVPSVTKLFTLVNHIDVEELPVSEEPSDEFEVVRVDICQFGIVPK